MPPESHALSCPNCGSEKISYERDALLVAEVLGLRDGVLRLAAEPQPAALDDVQLACSSCGCELDLEWVDARPLARAAPSEDPFRFDRSSARAAICDPEGAIWPVNSYSDADELNALVEAAVEADLIARHDSSAYILIYPLSISEPDPVLAVTRAQGPALLGQALKLREREGESPLEFTLRLLAEVAAEANALLCR